MRYTSSLGMDGRSFGDQQPVGRRALGVVRESMATGVDVRGIVSETGQCCKRDAMREGYVADLDGSKECRRHGRNLL